MSENDINSQEALRQPNRESGRVPENLIMPDGEAIFYRTFFAQAQSDAFYQALLESTNWKQEKIKFFG